MYTRSYSDDGHGIIIPESYGGTLLREDERVISEDPSGTQAQTDEVTKNPWESEKKKEKQIHKEDESVGTFSPLSKIPFANYLPNIFKNVNLSLQKIGTEEILLIATAAFLFFTKNGDKECAVMLLLLLFLS